MTLSSLNVDSSISRYETRSTKIPHADKPIKNCIKKGLITFSKILILSGLAYSVLSINTGSGNHINTFNAISCNDNVITNSHEIKSVNSALFVKTDKDNVELEINESKDLADQIPTFVKKHLREIKEIQQLRFSFDKRQVGKWKELGRGAAKIAYVHPELPDYVIKFPGSLRHTANIVKHYDNFQIAQKIIEESRFHHLVLPETHLITSLKWPILIEKKLYFEKSSGSMNMISSVAKDQLKEFLLFGGFCDIYINLGHNAKYLENTVADPKIGIFDLDCRKDATER